jgi:DNA modification methylase
MHSAQRSLEWIDIDEIIPFPSNARTHSKKQIEKLAQSMRRRGVTNPLLIDEKNMLLAGHGRLAAARKLSLRVLPCIRLLDMSEQDKRAYRVADNQLALEAAWDLDLLASELQLLVNEEYELELTGFDPADIDSILLDFEDRQTHKADLDDIVPPLDPEGPAVSREGDCWIMGNHRLVCGNARDASVIDLLMEGEKADMAFTDAPYNVPVNGHVSGKGKTRHREFAEAVGEMTFEQYAEFLTVTHRNLANACRDGAIVYSCIDWRHVPEMLAAGSRVFSEQKNMCVWVKTNAGMGSFYRSQHEIVIVWKVGQAPHINNFGLGERGRHRSNVWTYAGVNTFKAGRMEELTSHPTVKPVAMVMDAIRDVSRRNDLVLDVFGGSGTTLIAADKTGRRARLVELDPCYCDVIIRRWNTQTSREAYLASTGEPFDQLKSKRHPKSIGDKL